MTNSISSMACSLPLDSRRQIEQERCRRDPARLIHCHGQLKDRAAGRWAPFHLWPAQRQVLAALQSRRRIVALKARQLGFTWLVLGYALWLMLTRRSTVLLFSRRDEEAKDLMNRLAGMHRRLPEWARQEVRSESAHGLELANEAEAMSFPTTGGRSYTASLAVVDEADYVPDLDELLDAVEPTVGDGGQIVLLSTPDKSRPQSPFKRLYLAARRGENDYHPVFFGWRERPGRDDDWYEREKRNILSRTGALDDLHQEYPATDVEALSPRTLDKRIAPAWLQQCYREQAPLPPAELPAGAPALPGLEVYAPPRQFGIYVVGADPAEGNPTSDDSALSVLDCDTGEECAALAGRLQPATFAAAIDQIGRWYNQAPVMIERNNHGHAVLLWLAENSGLALLPGHDGRPGWLSSIKGKVMLYDACADALRNSEAILHALATFTQLSSIEGATLRAPEGEHDDRADAFALALASIAYSRGRSAPEPEATVLRT